MWTIGKILKWTTDFFKRKNLDSPRLDAEILLAHVLQKNRVYLYSNFDEPLEKSELNLYHDIIEQRANGKPAAYIIGHKEFFTLKFKVNSNVLIPRPDTETLVTAVSQRLKSKDSAEILDLCTGSGCVGLSIINFLPNVSAVLTDISEDVIEIAHENAANLILLDRTEFFCGNLFESIKDSPRQFDAIVSNPPYIPSQDILKLSNDVKNYEPILALDGGTDGLDFYRRIASESLQYLKPDGFVAVEIGFEQADDVEKIFRSAGFNQVELKKDLSNINRVVLAWGF